MTPPAPSASPLTPLDWTFTPAEAVLRWPSDRPLAALISAGPAHGSARWSILASPSGAASLESIHSSSTPRAHESGDPPFAGGWIGWLGYDLGRALEPRAGVASGAVDERGWDTSRLFRCDAAYAHDNTTGRWRRIGEGGWLPDLARAGARDARTWAVGGLKSHSGRERYIAAVARTLEYIRAGDIYQANIAHRLSADFEGDTRALFARLCETMGPRYAGLIEAPDGGSAVLSVSPELFLNYDAATRRVVTRPIKGTRPATAAPAELLSAEKDAAELTMIVDLMRNDLGRVCEFGSVRVTDPRSIETHGGVGALADSGVHHAVATVEGRLRAGLGARDLIGATFPAGSVTGAPKIRAMQIIDELEPVRRGPYCGAVGYISDCGSAQLNVAIRTAAITGSAAPGVFGSLAGTLDYSVGAGIVADSDPAMEWEETLAKAAGFQRTIAASPAVAAGTGAGA